MAKQPSLPAELARVGGLLEQVLELEVSACMHAKAVRLTTLANAATKVSRDWFFVVGNILAPTFKPSRLASWQTIFDYELNALSQMWPNSGNIDVFAARARRLAKVARILVQGKELQFQLVVNDSSLCAGEAAAFVLVHDEGVTVDFSVKVGNKQLDPLDRETPRGKTRILYLMPESSDQYLIHVDGQAHVGRFKSQPVSQVFTVLVR